MLKRIQAKPEHVKKRISLALTIVIFSGIVFVWMSSWSARTISDESREKTASPTESFNEVFSGIVSEIKSKIADTPFFGSSVERIDSNTVGTENVGWQATSSVPVLDLSRAVIIDRATSTNAF